MKLVWLTDIHLNFLDDEARQVFYDKIVKAACDGVLISGDIAEATSVCYLLKEMSGYVKKPIYFILGNHDYYRGSVNEVRQAVTALTKSSQQLKWLPASGIQQLNNDTILLGQDGWADGRLGDYLNSTVTLNDSRMIADLYQERILGKFQLLEKMQQLADVDALQLHNNIHEAVNNSPKRIIVLTHVPPFRECCMHQGKISGDDWLPYFSSKAVGDVLNVTAKDNPDIEFLVLCGHTHSEAFYQPLNNLTIKAGKAEYYGPELQELIRF